jgi:starch synthase (maltosyl-transferring)
MAGGSKSTRKPPPQTLRSPFLSRVVIENVRPEVDGGRFPIKRTVGERVEVTADIFADGHDTLYAVVRHRPSTEKEWQEAPMRPLVNDRWQAEFNVGGEGIHIYTIQAWGDAFQSWKRDFLKKYEAGQDVSVDLLVGVDLIDAAAERAGTDEAQLLGDWAENLRKLTKDHSAAAEGVRDPLLAAMMERFPDRSGATTYRNLLEVVVDRERARFSSWYEMFPRSASSLPGKHGTFKDVEKRMEYVAGMGFDVLYFPPIQPIGRINRKGKNNSETAEPDDLGSPWAIGAEEGGHKVIHPELGTLEDFRRVIKRAKDFGMEIALDIAFQCAPDHPYVKEHPEWFRMRPDGTVQYAENPPKKYQDIYPLNFEGKHAQALCEELRSVVKYWIDQGVRIFRVDNPHTKPLEFWEWMIREIKNECPDALFLAEAFTRPKVMYRLAKAGFTQSYTYFAWRNTKWELTEYFTELTQTEVREYFRPNLWPNTPDILNEFLQVGSRPAFMIRLALAATLGANYGIYGPAFELGENRAQRRGSEEYLESEKYQLRHWDIQRTDSLSGLIARINRIRKDNRALQSDWSLRFHNVDNDQLIAYSKSTKDQSNIIVVVVNLDPFNKQSGFVDLPLEDFHLDPYQPYQVHDLLTDNRYFWHGPHNYVELNPLNLPMHIFRIRRKVRSEQDFDYFM